MAESWDLKPGHRVFNFNPMVLCLHCQLLNKWSLVMIMTVIPLPQPFQSLPESLELSSPRSPEADWGRPPGGDRDHVSARSGERLGPGGTCVACPVLTKPPSALPGLGSPRVSQASSPEGRCPTSPQPGTKVGGLSGPHRSVL